MSLRGCCCSCNADLECPNCDAPDPEPLDPLRAELIAAALKWRARRSDATEIKLADAIRRYEEGGGK